MKKKNLKIIALAIHALSKVDWSETIAEFNKFRPVIWDFTSTDELTIQAWSKALWNAQINSYWKFNND